MNFDRKGTIQITTFPGLVDLLAAEVESLGFAVESTHRTGVETVGTLADTRRLNLHLRTALHVLYLVRSFNAETPDDVYHVVASIEWEDIIPPDDYLSVVSHTDTPAIDNTMYANVRVKDAIVDRIASKTGRRPDSGPERKGVVIDFNWRRRDCWLYLNTSGEKLSDRGYRRIPYRAPLREILAAGIILETGYDGSRPLVAPMCGSGTLAVEAALIGLDRPAGIQRNNFGFMHLLGFDVERWRALRAESKEGAARTLGTPIVASDISPQAVDAAKKNARTAGVDHLISFQVCDFAETTIPPGGAIVVLNPPYGQRLGEIALLEKTYSRIGDFLKQKCAGCTGYIFTGNLDLVKKVGLRARRRVPFWNGRIECRLLEYEIYEGTRRTRADQTEGDKGETL